MKPTDYVYGGLGTLAVAGLLTGIVLITGSRPIAGVVAIAIGVPGVVLAIIGAVAKGVEVGIRASRDPE